MKILSIYLFLLFALVHLAIGQKCETPKNLTVKQLTPTTIQFTWNSVPNAYIYRFAYRPSTSFYWITDVKKDTSIIINNLIPEIEYEIWVRCYCKGDNNVSVNSDTITFRLKLCKAPLGLRVDSTGYRFIRFIWNSSEDAKEYDFQYSLSGSEFWESIKMNATDTTAILSNLFPENLYDVRVRSLCTDSTYSDFNKEKIKLLVHGCRIPNNITIDTTTYTTAILHWDSVSYATDYRIKYKRIQDSVWQTTQTKNTYITLEQLSEGTRYEFRVQSACPRNDFSGFSDGVTFTTKDCFVPNHINSTIISPTSAMISWNSTFETNQYILDYKSVSSPTWNTENTQDTTLILNNLKPDSVYQCRIRSECRSNKFSGYSDTIIFRMNPCAIPTKLSIDSMGFHYIRLQWDASENTNIYEFQYKKSKTNQWTQIRIQDKLQAIISNLESGVSYEGRVRSVCENNGIYSGFSEIIPFTAYNCARPSDIRIDSILYRTAKLYWDPFPFATEYRIEYKKPEEQDWKNLNTPNAYLKLTQLTEGTNYQIRMRSLCPSGESSSYSDTIEMKTKFCSIPENVVATVTSPTTATISWDSIPNSVGYQVEYKPEKESIWERLNTQNTYLTITEFDPSTVYDYVVRNLCTREDFSGYSRSLKLWTGILGISDAEVLPHFLLSPNPAKDFISIRMEGKMMGDPRIEIYSVTGVKMATHPLIMNAVTNISTSDLADGVYLCKFLIQDKWVGTQKLIIAK